MSGFFIKKLTLENSINEEIKPSTITFDKGLNIVYGGSNIGKTFIYQCIDYTLGGDESPKIIKESKIYNICELIIETYLGKTYIIERELRGNSFILKGIGDGVKLDNYTEIVKFLLSKDLTNMKGKDIRIDNYGKVGELEFERLKKYFMVNEDDILVKKSHIMGKTIKDKNSFKFLITQKDDSSIPQKTPKSNFDKEEAQIKILEDDIKEIEKKVKDLKGDGLFEQNIEDKEVLKKKIKDKNAYLSKLTQTIINQLEVEHLCPLCKQSLGKGKFQEIVSSLNVEQIISNPKKDEEITIVKKELAELEKNYDDLSSNLNKIFSLEEEKKNKIKRIKTIKSEMNTNLKNNENIQYTNILSSDLKTVVGLMSEILKSIKFEDFTSVFFLEEELDFEVNDDNRKLYGQGYRASIYTSFLVAILQYLKDLNSEIGFMIIDSPFNAYEVKKDGIDLSYNFYKYLKDNETIQNRQVIFFENSKPHDDFKDNEKKIREEGFLYGKLSTYYSYKIN